MLLAVALRKLLAAALRRPRAAAHHRTARRGLREDRGEEGPAHESGERRKGQKLSLEDG